MISGIGALFLLPLIAGLGVYLAILSKDLPSLEQLEHYDPHLSTTILSADGEIIKELFIQKRHFVPLEQVPEDLMQAVIVTEDRRFFDHWGLHLGRIFRAILIDIAHLSFKQGASTLTQQLARNLYLTPEKKISRKLKETLTALQIERTYSKREILEMYLTQAYFGHGAYGVEIAAQRYFSKNVSNLTLDECALLAAQLKAPTHYSPFTRPQAAIGRRNLILGFLYKTGYLDESRYQRAVSAPLRITKYVSSDQEGLGPYFSEMVRIQLERMGDELGFDYYQDGLTIYSTLDSRLQACAEHAVSAHLDTLQKAFNPYFKNRIAPGLIREKFPNLSSTETYRLLNDPEQMDSLFKEQSRIQAAFVALDPSTGRILALVGGRSFTESKFNRAVQAIRQPGSAFKPFAYTAAIDNGYSPTLQLLNQDVVVHLPNGDRWAPENYDRSRGGLTTLREGLSKSLNLVAARLVQEIVNPSDVVHYAQQMGIHTKLDAVDAIALGCSGVLPIDITAAYGVFANRGVWCEPFGIIRVVNQEGSILHEHSLNRKVALSEQTAYIMTDLLKSVVNNGTGASIRSRFGFSRPAAGKTGTSNDFKDAWFIGFTPQLVVGVWVGLDDPAVSLGSEYSGQSGSRAALPIWAIFMNAAYDTLGWEVADFIMPDGVVRMEICAESFKKANDSCPQIIQEVFRVENAPLETCPIHRGSSRWGRFFH
ncbi:MAG: PBP1A family penicillin-binding protein [bacterium]